MIYKLVVLYLLSMVWAYALPYALEQKISQSGISRQNISIYVKETKIKGKILAYHKVQTTRTPASVIKVMTTYAALLKLGFGYRFETHFYISGKLEHKVLHGDLIIQGFGDPSLRSEDLKSIVQKIKRYGISHISGNIVIDRSYFNVHTNNSSGFDKNRYSPYNAMPDAMMFNERVSTILVTPKTQSLSKFSPDYSYTIENKLKFVNKRCRGKYTWPQTKIVQKGKETTVFLRGKISKHCGTRKLSKVLSKPYVSFYYALKEKLKDEGITVDGNMRLEHRTTSSKKIFVHYSATLENIVSKTAKKSNNLYARHLLLHLGATVYGAPATLAKGRKAVASILKSHRALSGGTFFMENGSGLSRTSKLSAKMLATLYDKAYQRYGKRWLNTLSIAGIDGTIKRRFRGSVVAKRAWMKTGTLRHVKNISGYVKAKSGKLYTVVILVQTKKGNWKAAKLQNEIIKWVVQRG